MTRSAARVRLSCSWHLEQILENALHHARPHLSNTLKSSKSFQRPAFLGVRRSMQVNADYQTSIALLLGNRFKESSTQLAHALVESIHAKDSLVLQSVHVSNGGFLNFQLKNEWLANHLIAIATNGVTPDPNTHKNILVDYCAPNYGKRLHVGHLRSSVIGDTISNLLSFRGHTVARISHTGDVGSAFATLIVELMEQQVPLETVNDTVLGQLYEAGKRRFSTDAVFKTKVDEMVLALQMIGRTDSIERTWKRACTVSQQAYQQVFDRLNVRVIERGESTYLKLIPSVLTELKAQGLAVESRGALCIFVNGPAKPPMLVQKKDGGYLYATIDLACLYSRIKGFPEVDTTCYDEIIYVTDQSQRLHFQHLFQAAKAAGWLSRHSLPDVELRHAWFGLVLGSDGTKLSSRHGAIEFLEELLNEAGNECSRRSVLSSNATSTHLNQQLGDAAVRYFDLAQHRERDYKFNFDSVLQMKGNTGVYLLYATARLHGILRKAQIEAKTAHDLTTWANCLNQNHTQLQLLMTDDAKDWEPSERALALLLCQFDDEVSTAVTHLHPHLLCDYLFRVVSQFHSFYEHCRVIGDTKQESRLLLCAATYAVLERGLQLVGLNVMKRM